MVRQKLFDAVKDGDIESVRYCLQQDPRSLTDRDESGATALHYAALKGHREIVCLLVETGADVNSLDSRFGATPSGWAIEYLRELGGFLAFEIDDAVFAISRRDIKWLTRYLDRFPGLKDQVDADGKSLKDHAMDCGDESVMQLFR